MFAWSTPVYKYIQHRREITEENIRKNTPPKQCCWKRPMKKEEGKTEVEMTSAKGAGDASKPDEKKSWNPFAKKQSPQEQTKEQTIITTKEPIKEEVKEPPKTDTKPEETKKKSIWNPFAKKDAKEEVKPDSKSSVC